MPIDLAQKLKQGTYTQLRDAYGELTGAQTEAQKALAAGLRNEIEKAVPEVASHNARASDLWNALNVAQRRAAIQGNNNPLGLTSLAPTGVGAAAMAIDRSALLRSLMANALYRTGKVSELPYAPIAAAALAQGGAQ